MKLKLDNGKVVNLKFKKNHNGSNGITVVADGFNCEMLITFNLDGTIGRHGYVNPNEIGFDLNKNGRIKVRKAC